MMSVELDQRCVALVQNLGLGKADDVHSVTALTGGVASDIASIDLGSRVICAKFALRKLRVQEDWYAPVGRNNAEYAWLEVAGRAVPGVVPELLGQDKGANGFAMEFIQGDETYLWKSALLNREPILKEAGKVGDALGRIHSLSAQADFDATQFQNQSDFHELRVEPYLEFTASVHRDVAPQILTLVDVLKTHDIALLHGDISPKNILFRAGKPIILDAECATMGDPSFDVAFCLNHLILKSFHMPDRVAELLDEALAFWTAYAAHVDWEDVTGLESRVCRLLPALMLARVDGKSPVEYLGDFEQDRVRLVAKDLLATPVDTLAVLLREIQHSLIGVDNERH